MFWRWSCDIQIEFISFVGIMKVVKLLKSMAFMRSVYGSTKSLKSGRKWLICSTTFLLELWLITIFSASMVDYLRWYRRWIRYLFLMFYDADFCSRSFSGGSSRRSHVRFVMERSGRTSRLGRLERVSSRRRLLVWEGPGVECDCFYKWMWELV